MITRHHEALAADLRDAGVNPDPYIIEKLIEKGWRKSYLNITNPIKVTYGEHDRPEYSYFHNEPRLF